MASFEQEATPQLLPFFFFILCSKFLHQIINKARRKMKEGREHVISCNGRELKMRRGKGEFFKK